MIECRHCREFIRGNPERLGARCPRCRLPLYEKVQVPRRAAGESGSAACVFHPANQALGPCERCGAFLCGVCRTRWRDQPLCPACVERAVATKDTAPEEAHSHRRQALLSLVFAAGGWLLFLLGSLPLLALQGANGQLAILGRLIVLASFIPALFGVGQATAAIRTRGERMTLATLGLAIASTQLGVIIGLALLNRWHN
jgi:hypothetical protein